MEKIACTVGILTRNSEKTLRRALDSVVEFEEILICDGGSTDTTLDIAADYGCRLLKQDLRYTDQDGRIVDYAGVRNQCLRAARHPWFLYIDSDEAASPELVAEIRKVVAEGSGCDGFRIPERMILMGRMIEHSSNYPGYQFRFLRTDREIYFKKPVHERPVFTQVPAKTCTLAGPWYVFWEREDIYNYMSRNKKYIALEVGRSSDRTLRTFVSSYLPRNIRSILGIAARTFAARFMHPPRKCMPLVVEWGRIRYHLRLIASLFPKSL